MAVEFKDDITSSSQTLNVPGRKGQELTVYLETGIPDSLSGLASVEEIACKDAFTGERVPVTSYIATKIIQVLEKKFPYVNPKFDPEV